MTPGSHVHGNRTQTLCVFAAASFLLLSCGCTQAPAGQSSQADETPIVIVEQPDASHIQITYHGSLQTGKLVELEISITDSNGKVTTQSMGSRLATTPIPYGSSHTFTGSFDGKDRVFVTGFFSDGSQKPMIDTIL
jgi:hypothetical protein